MINKIKTAILKPKKAFRYLLIAIKHRLKTSKGVLIFVGIDPNGELDIIYPGYKICYCFEANPNRYKKLIKKFARKDNIKLFNCAVADYDGEIEFNISSNDGASSSIGNFKELWTKNQTLSDVKMINTIKVPCINLLNFCKEHNIDYIDDYISDIQGMDLQVLKTLKVMIEERRIGSIKCEVTKDEFKNIYYDLPDNSESGFHQLLNQNYHMVAKGHGILIDNKYDQVSKKAWEMDCKWKLKKKE